MMDNYLVDVPVKINIWIREKCFRKQFDVIRIAKPSILFVQSDGGRNNNEWEAIKKSRAIIDEEIDWNCQVYKLYKDTNCGLYSMESEMRSLVWSKVDRCIFLEDDDIPSVSFFEFCKTMLEKYKDDYRIQGICGFNPLETYEAVQEDYFFTATSNPWGIARWKRSDEIMFDFDISFLSDKRILDILKVTVGKQTYKMIDELANSGRIDGHIPWLEFYNGVGRITQNALFIFPKKNMISNIGCSNDAAHSNDYNLLTSTEKKLFMSNTFDVSFPLKDPKYVISDVLFQKQVRKIIGPSKIVRFYRRVVKLFKMLYYRGPSFVKNEMFKFLKHKKET